MIFLAPKWNEIYSVIDHFFITTSFLLYSLFVSLTRWLPREIFFLFFFFFFFYGTKYLISEMVC